MQFLLCDTEEAFYGGAAGGGKSDALLMAALLYVHYPGYNAILFRRTFSDLALPEALMARSMEWLGEKARWDAQQHMWTFPCGATLSFGYLDHRTDKYRYQSSAFQYIAFDELTQFQEADYTYLFSRLRRLEGVTIPLRMRSASNPGGIGHAWVKQRFLVEGSSTGRLFIPAKLEDNPHLDQRSYSHSLRQLDPVTRARLLHGDWEILDAGGMFQRYWFPIVVEYPRGEYAVRYWDLAATRARTERHDPDWTVGVLMTILDGVCYVLDVQRARVTSREKEQLIQQTAQLDEQHGFSRFITYIEQEPGSSGVDVIDYYARKVLVGYAFKGHRTTGSKEMRAAPYASAAEAGNVKLVQGSWIRAYLDELSEYPYGAHDDQVDASSGAYMMLTHHRPRIPKARY